MTIPETLLEYMTTTKIGEKGQLTIPKQFREDLRLETGAPFVVLRMGDGLILLPEQQRFDQLCAQISAALLSAGATSKAVLETLPETRQRIYNRRFGKSGSTTAAPRRLSPSRRKK